MRDIDRNINSLFYNMLENNSSITVLNNFNSSNIDLSKFNNVFSFDVNISETAIFYSNRFLLTSNSKLSVNRIKPIIPAFNIAGTIDIFKRVV